MTLRPTPILAAVLLMLIAGTLPPARAADADRQTRVRAACVYHIARSIRRLSRPVRSEPLVIGFMGEDREGMSSVFAAELAALPPDDRRIHLRRIGVERRGDGLPEKTLAAVRECHLLYLFPSGLSALEEQVLRTAAGAAVLTVGETAEMLAKGGCVALILEGAHIRIYVNPQALKAAQLQLDTRVMQHATRYPPE